MGKINLNTLWYLKVYRGVKCQIEGKRPTEIALRSIQRLFAMT